MGRRSGVMWGVLATLLFGAGGHGPAQAATKPVPAAAATTAPAPAPAPAAVTPAGPQQTTAMFGDWVLRCVRPAGTKQCELVQVVQQDGRPVAQTAIGSPGRGQPLQLTVLVPPFVSFGTAPALLAAGGEGAGVTLAWRRCLPGGCIAEGELNGDVLGRIGGWAQAGRIVFADGAGRAAAVPLAPQGLTQALDALGREEAP